MKLNLLVDDLQDDSSLRFWSEIVVNWKNKFKFEFGRVSINNSSLKWSLFDFIELTNRIITNFSK